MKITKTNSDADREGYREITKEIKRKARKCMETWIEEKCQEAEKATRIVNTGKLFQTAREICYGNSIEHYEELYNNGNSVDRTVLEELSACNEHAKKLDIMECEVEAAIKSLKKGKAPGEDNIAAEMIQVGGGCSLEMQHGLCNQITRKNAQRTGTGLYYYQRFPDNSSRTIRRRTISRGQFVADNSSRTTHRKIKY